jgi:hypothetical protein
MKEHLPKWVKVAVESQTADLTHKPPASAIAKHILTSGHHVDMSCAFKVLLRHTNARLLRFAEAVAINRFKPALCIQKQLFVSLRLPWL